MAVKNTGVAPLQLKVELRKKKARRAKVVTVRPGQVSKPIHIASVVQKRRLKSLARRKTVRITPLAYIGPRVGDRPAAGSYGYEDVYICYDCGGPIVFRGSPPVP
ncbi:MAG: hypothetical protein ACE5JO_08475, partial [Candidatus Binatia bacterium]